MRNPIELENKILIQFSLNELQEQHNQFCKIMCNACNKFWEIVSNVQDEKQKNGDVQSIKNTETAVLFKENSQLKERVAYLEEKCKALEEKVK